MLSLFPSQFGTVGLVGTGAPLRAAFRRPVQRDPFGEQDAGIVPAPGAVVVTAARAASWRAAADVVTAVKIVVAGDRDFSLALRAAGADEVAGAIVFGGRSPDDAAGNRGLLIRDGIACLARAEVSGWLGLSRLGCRGTRR